MILRPLSKLVLTLSVALSFCTVPVRAIDDPIGRGIEMFNGEYEFLTTRTIPLSVEPGHVYCVSMAMNPRLFSGSNDQIGNQIIVYLALNGEIGQWLGQNWYLYEGSPYRNVVSEEKKVSIGGQDRIEPVSVGFRLDTTKPLWSIKFFRGGEGFNEDGTYVGGEMFHETTDIEPFVTTELILKFDPVSADTPDIGATVSDSAIVVLKPGN